MTTPESDIGEIKRKLSAEVDSFKTIPKSKRSALEELRSEIETLKKKGATNAQVAELLANSGLAVGRDTVRRFVAGLGLNKRTEKRESVPKQSRTKAKQAQMERLQESETKHADLPEGFNPPPNIADL